METGGTTVRGDNKEKKRKRESVKLDDTSIPSESNKDSMESNGKGCDASEINGTCTEKDDRKGRGRLKKALKRTRKGQATKEDIDILRKNLDGDARLEDSFGNAARIKLSLKKSYFKKSRRLGNSEIRNFLKWTLTDNLGKMPKWITVENKPLVRLVLLVATEENIRGEEDAFAKGRRVMTCDLRSSRDNLEVKNMAECVMCVKKASKTLAASNGKTPIAVDLEKTCERSDGGAANPAAASGADQDSAPAAELRRTRLLALRDELASRWQHSEQELSEGEYPNSCPDGYLATMPREKVADTKTRENSTATATRDISFEPMVAIDCEMCRTERGLELTRVTALNWDGDVLLDELVQPERPILDYLTKYSGITEKMMKGVTTSLEDVRGRLLRFVRAETIAIGHSLQCDLKALKIFHRNVLDTAILYPHPAGPPKRHKLRYITKGFLKRNIQQTGAGGHDSKEDALAALDLVKLKVSRGGSFGIPETVIRESFFATLRTHCKETDLFCVGTRQSVSRAHKDVASVTCQRCTTDETSLEYAVKLLEEARRSGRSKFVFVPVVHATYEDLARCARALPINGIMVVVSRKRSTSAASEERKRRAAKKEAGTWLPAEEKEFRGKVRMTQDAIVHVTFNNDRPKPTDKEDHTGAS